MSLSLAGFTAMALLVKHLATVREVSPWWALFLRAAVGMLVVAAVFAPRKRVSFRRAVGTRLLATRGILGAFGTACYYLTLPQLGAGKATLIGNTWVIWAGIFAVFVLREPLGLRKVLGMLAATAGIALLMGIHSGELAAFGRFEALAIAGAFAAAAVVVVIRRLTLTESSGTIFASQCVYTGLLALPFLFALPTPSPLDFVLLVTAALCAAVGQLAMTEGFRFLPVSSGGAFQILLPLTITLASVALFGEAFTLVQVLGGTMILLGCYQAAATGK